MDRKGTQWEEHFFFKEIKKEMSNTWYVRILRHLREGQ